MLLSPTGAPYTAPSPRAALTDTSPPVLKRRRAQ